MDGHRFDNMTRALGRHASRRGVLRALAATAAGTLLGTRRQVATAQQSPLDLDLDLLVCVGLNPLLAARVCIALNLPHVARAACEDGRCVIKACEPGWADCDGDATTGCETPLGTPQNCAGCGDACASGVCQDGTCLLVNGEPCTDGPECLSGFCVDGVCCDGPCTGQCQACNVAGSVGTCATAVGIACDDDDPCTENDACHASGICAGTPLDCSTLDDQCNVGVCVDGACQAQPANEGESCDDGDPCTTGETCQGGVCTGGQPVECLECQTCEGGACVPVANDTPCEGGVCTDGSCQCVPSCDGRECGDDGCGGSCGTCAGANKACLDGQCSCVDGLPCSGDCNCWPRVEEDWICVQGGVAIDCAPCTTSAECQDAGWDWCIAASPGPHCPGPICAFHDGVCPGV